MYKLNIKHITMSSGGLSRKSKENTMPLKKLYIAVCAVLTTGLISQSYAEDAIENVENSQLETAEIEKVSVVGKRNERISSGATKLPLAIKETPQSISVLDSETMNDFAVTASNEALKLSTGLNVDQYETNRATFNSRGFNIQLTQIDGLGMTNDWGTVQGQMDTFLFEKIEFIRGANGLLTGVGNASGTINYVRKRPTNEDGGTVVVSAGTDDNYRVAVDYNKVLTEDGAWAGRVVMVHEDKDSYIRATDDQNTTLYGVIDGQIGQNGILSAGITIQDSQQDSPMWGSLSLYRTDGSMAEFDVSSSTSQDWTYWDIQSQTAFIEYTHFLNANWEAKATYTRRETQGQSRLFYATTAAGLNLDNTGYFGQVYSDETERTNELVDLNVSGHFSLFGNDDTLTAGVSYSKQDTERSTYDYDKTGFIDYNPAVDEEYWVVPLPAFPYPGDAISEPLWGALSLAATGTQELTRLYFASRVGVTVRLNVIAGLNAIKLEREGSTLYSGVVDTVYPATEEISSYAGVTYDVTDNALAYLSYSDIFQNQDQTDFDGDYLDPTQGVNMEAGVKVEWFEQKLLTSLAIFSAEQQGLATYAGINTANNYYYEPKDVTSEGVEFEAVGKVNDNSNLMIGFTKLKLTGPDGDDIYEWVPRTTVKARFDTRLTGLPQLKMGVSGRWQSETKGTYAEQDSYLVVDVFTSYELSKAASLKLNINNVFDEKYVGGLKSGALYGAPVNGLLSFEYKI